MVNQHIPWISLVYSSNKQPWATSKTDHRSGLGWSCSCRIHGKNAGVGVCIGPGDSLAKRNGGSNPSNPKIAGIYGINWMFVCSFPQIWNKLWVLIHPKSSWWSPSNPKISHNQPIAFHQPLIHIYQMPKNPPKTSLSLHQYINFEGFWSTTSDFSWRKNRQLYDNIMVKISHTIELPTTIINYHSSSTSISIHHQLINIPSISSIIFHPPVAGLSEAFQQLHIGLRVFGFLCQGLEGFVHVEQGRGDAHGAHLPPGDGGMG